jgi:hypothetical protein
MCVKGFIAVAAGVWAPGVVGGVKSSYKLLALSWLKRRPRPNKLGRGIRLVRVPWEMAVP